MQLALPFEARCHNLHYDCIDVHEVSWLASAWCLADGCTHKDNCECTLVSIAGSVFQKEPCTNTGSSRAGRWRWQSYCLSSTLNRKLSFI